MLGFAAVNPAGVAALFGALVTTLLASDLLRNRSGCGRCRTATIGATGCVLDSQVFSADASRMLGGKEPIWVEERAAALSWVVSVRAIRTGVLVPLRFVAMSPGGAVVVYGALPCVDGRPVWRYVHGIVVLAGIVGGGTK